MTDFTPTTDDVRTVWTLWYDQPRPQESEEGFDRWLAEYTRQQREEAYNEGYSDGYDACGDMS